MDDVRGDSLGSPDLTTTAAVIANITNIKVKAVFVLGQLESECSFRIAQYMLTCSNAKGAPLYMYRYGSVDKMTC